MVAVAVLVAVLVVMVAVVMVAGVMVAVDNIWVKVVDTVWVKVAAVDSVNAEDAMDSVAISVEEVSGMVAGGVQNAVGGTTGADIVVRGMTGAKIGGKSSRKPNVYGILITVPLQKNYKRDLLK